MKKFLAVIISVCILGILFAGCGEKKAANIDVAAMADELSTKLTFKDSMSAVEKDTVLALYNLSADQVAEAKLYMSTGATAEEIAVFKAADGKEADVKTAVKNRIEAQKTNFENYVPGEMTKLQNPTVYENGSYVVLVISDDDAASLKAVQDYVK